MAFSGNNNGFMSDINVTPFVDVMLVLLIIFMVTTPMMIEGINVSLPEATSEPLLAKQDPFIITIDKNNQVFINDYQVGLDFLQEKLIKILDGRISQEVYLKADKNISYGIVMRVMSEIKGAGVEKLGMMTEPANSNNNKEK